MVSSQEEVQLSSQPPHQQWYTRDTFLSFNVENTSVLQRCAWVFFFVIVAAGSCWNYFSRHFFFYILNQFSIIDNHIKPTQKKSYVTFANELFGSFDIIKNMRVACWGAQRWQLCQTINEQRKEIITNSFPLSCGNPFIFIFKLGFFCCSCFLGSLHIKFLQRTGLTQTCY